MQPLQKKIQDLQADVASAYARLDIAAKLAEIRHLEAELGKPEAWSNPEVAQEKSRQLANLQSITTPWQELTVQLEEMAELVELGDRGLEEELTAQFSKAETRFKELKKELRFQGDYDDHAAIVRLSAGVGGTDAQDWTQSLERMYLRWAEKNNLEASVIEHSPGEEAGLKSSVMEINGPFAYGKLKSEHGVHRLVRLSPFNSDAKRQTSFALVEVLPHIDAPEEVMLDDKDLRIDVYRAGGHGGQSVNTTDSAVRVTHLPTNTVVAIQNERSQLQNKETALRILRSKLAQLRLEQHANSIADLKAGESANWGSQIRNYVLHPYTMVKDTRTGYQETNAADVLDGQINGFIDAYLES